MNAGLVTTGNEVYHGRIKDTFSDVVKEKLREYGAEVIKHTVTDDDNSHIEAAIREMIEAGCDMVICTGGMSVDPDDRTPLAIRNVCGEVVTYGAPVLPGAMFLLAYCKRDGSSDSIPVMGLPGCVMYARRTIFDLVLPRVLADVPVTPEDLARMGQGGLCLNCDVCIWPNCGFGKG
jgi:molybdenum cofactor synthesis domain-containing protein